MPRAVLDGASLTIHRCAAVLVFRYDAKRDQDHARAVAEMSYADMQCTMLNTPDPAAPVIKDTPLLLRLYLCCDLNAIY